YSLRLSSPTPAHHRLPPSFPTRRSSDLHRSRQQLRRPPPGGAAGAARGDRHHLSVERAPPSGVRPARDSADRPGSLARYLSMRLPAHPIALVLALLLPMLAFPALAIVILDRPPRTNTE